MHATQDHEAWVRCQPGSHWLVLDSPHSGTEYPPDFRSACPLPQLRCAEDTHVDALWDFAPALGAALIAARFPRTYIDANRALDEIDPALLAEPWPGRLSGSSKVRLGKGLVWRMLDDGTPIYDRQLTVDEIEQRIRRCWAPYHSAVAGCLEAAHQRHGRVLLLDCHSMPAVAERHATEHPWLVHADVVLGDRDGSSADPRLTRWIERFFNSRGYTVSINHPYKGVELVRRHGQPAEQRHAIQLELNKRLYMNEDTLQRHAGYEPLRQCLQELVQALLSLDLERLLGRPLPA
ncbi:N-formylglutamate amidohydrolase [Aquabacterium sp.]|uniref:N-formylglutamate amidohydrolase n=1 Tax=Aquabacterium sp. TaxID=1872578 RepID=UPI0037834800